MIAEMWRERRNESWVAVGALSLSEMLGDGISSLHEDEVFPDQNLGNGF